MANVPTPELHAFHALADLITGSMQVGSVTVSDSILPSVGAISVPSSGWQDHDSRWGLTGSRTLGTTVHWLSECSTKQEESDAITLDTGGRFLIGKKRRGLAGRKSDF